jgi:hypothetical protein
VIKRHVSAEAIAEFSAGEISGRKAARISSHLAGCHECARLHDDLARVPALLASTEVPPLPDHLAARIQTALMTESARRVSLGAGSDRAQEPEGSGWSWPRMPRMPVRTAGWAAAAAAAVVVAGGGSYLIVDHQGAGSGTSATSASSAPGHRAAAGAGAPLAPAARPAGPQLEYQRAGQPASFTPVVTGTDYVPARLAAQVQTTLAEYQKSTPASARQGSAGSLATPGSSPATGAGPSERIGSFTAGTLEKCVSRISAGARVLLVDIASYQAEDAAVIVTAGTSQGVEQVWVVGTGCSASRSDVLNRATLATGG